MSRFGRLWIGPALLVALTACAFTPSLSVDLDVASLTLYLGDDQDVTVHVRRTSAGSAAVNLAVDGVPAGVTATLSTTTLSGSGAGAALALHADTAAPPTTTTVRIVASDGSLSGSASFTLDVRSLTVHGTVLTLASRSRSPSRDTPPPPRRPTAASPSPA